MSEQLTFPNHAWKEARMRPAIEVGIDFLPAKYKNSG